MRQLTNEREQCQEHPFDIENIFDGMSEQMKAVMDKRCTMYSDNEILNRQKILLNIRENTDVTGTFEFCQSMESWNTRLEMSMGDTTLEEIWEMFGQTIESHVCHFFLFL